MRKPCLADLLEASQKLVDMDDPTGNAGRVGRWLDAYARESANRQNARKHGVTVNWLRKHGKDLK